MFGLFLCRNRAKKDSLTTPNLVFLMLKTVFDCTSRIIIYSTFMFVVNDGEFSTLLTVAAYYSTFAVLLLLLFNIIINGKDNYCSAQIWIGKCLNKINNQYLNL